MRNRIKNVFNSTVSEVAMLVIVCCLVVTTLPDGFGGAWNNMAVIAGIVGAAVFVGLLIWATVKLAAQKEVREMPVKARVIIESVSRLLLLYWFYIVGGPIIAAVWAVFILWDGSRTVKQLAG